MKLRKAAMKARHEKELNDLRNRMQKEIDQSINELKMSSDIRRMEAIEAQVNPWFYSVNKTLYLIDSCKVELICGGCAKLCEWFYNKTLSVAELEVDFNFSPARQTARGRDRRGAQVPFPNKVS